MTSPINTRVARGSIDLNLARFRQQGRAIIGFSKTIGDGIQRGVTGGVQGLNRLNQQLDATQKRLQAIRGEALALSAAGSAFTVFGLKAADDLRAIEIRFKAISKSEAEALALMETIENRAKALALPVRDVQSAFVGLIPAIRSSGEDLEDYIDLIARLSVLNPSEGAAGAVFAVREALTSGGTDLVSLSERFNLPRKELRELTEETGSFAEALDIALAKQGITAETAEELGRTGQAAFRRLRDSVRRFSEGAFDQFLDSVTDGMNSISEFLDSAPEGFERLVGQTVVLSTATAGLVVGLGQALSTYQNLKKLGIGQTLFGGSRYFFEATSGRYKDRATGEFVTSAVANSAKTTRGLFSTRNLVGAGAIAAGTAIGLGGVRAYGTATGDDYLANFTLDDALEQAVALLKQSATIISLVFIETARNISTALIPFVNTLINLPSTIELAILDVNEKFKNLRDGLDQFLVDVRNLFLGNPEEGSPNAVQRATALATDAVSNTPPVVQSMLPFLMPITASAKVLQERTENPSVGNSNDLSLLSLTGQSNIDAESTTLRIMELERQRKKNNEDAIEATNAFFDELLNGLFGINESTETAEDRLQAQAERLRERIQQGLDRIDGFFGGMYDAIAQQTLATFDDDLRFEEQRLQLAEDNDLTAINNAIQAREQEAEAIANLLPRLERLAPFSEEAAEKLEDARARMEALGSQADILRELLPAAFEAASDALKTDFLADIQKAEDEREEAFRETAEQVRKDLAELDQDFTSEMADFGDESTEKLGEWHERQQELTEDHLSKLEEIERRGREDIVSAAARLDATGVFNARKRREEERTKEEERFREQQEAENKKLDELRENLSEERQAILSNYQERKADILQQGNDERRLIRERYDEQVRLARQQYDEEYDELSKAYASQLSRTRTAYDEMDKITDTGFTTLEDRFSTFFSRVKQQADQALALVSSATSGGSTQGSVGATHSGDYNLITAALGASPLLSAPVPQASLSRQEVAVTVDFQNVPEGADTEVLRQAILGTMAEVYRFNAGGGY